MSPETKSKELFDKYKRISMFSTISSDMANEHSKQCALIAVDEIINELEQLRKPEYTTFIIEYGEPGISMDGYEKNDYWQQVKSNLENL